MHGRHLLAAALIGLLASGSVQAATITLQAQLSGANEIPPADPDGSGLATVTIDTIALTVMWEIDVANIDDVVAAHIHFGDSTVNGPILVDFSGALVGGPITDSDAAAIAANPSHWYVNVHTGTFPGGAIRGQLHRVAEPATAGLLLLGLLGIAGIRRRT
jgi:MYXO-CTERM domain-containing protein